MKNSPRNQATNLIFQDSDAVLDGEAGLDYQVKRSGNNHFLFASDFRHEIGPQDTLHEIEEVEEYEGLSDNDKAAILGGSALRFYNM